MLQIEIDNGSGFCFGVTTAIKKAEEELAKGGTLYCLGDIVHNSMEVERLHENGLVTINHDQLRELHDVKVLLRAHGEPPETYELARRNNIEIIDATCPVVLQLQKRIKKQYEEGTDIPEHKEDADRQIVIFGKNGHAEVLGLVGQTHSRAIVIEKFDDVKKLDFNRSIYLYSQTTKSLDEFHHIIDYIQSHISPKPSSRALIPSAGRWLIVCLILRISPVSTMLWCLWQEGKVQMARCFLKNVRVSMPTVIK